MHRALLSAVAAALAAAALLVTGIAAAAISPNYSVNGLGTAAGSNGTRLIGSGSGSTGDRLTWTADIEHAALGTGTTPITGGTLSAVSRGGGSSQLGGTFTGGTIAYDAARSSRSTCGDVVYDVVGNLEFDGWTGTFTAFVTQNRIRVLGRCFALTSTASGALSLTPVLQTPAPTTPPPPPATTPPPPPPPATTPPPGEF